jgi:hypothetical protein
MVNRIKDGEPWDAALQQTFRLTPDELITRFGQTIGVTNLRR